MPFDPALVLLLGQALSLLPSPTLLLLPCEVLLLFPGQALFLRGGEVLLRVCHARFVLEARVLLGNLVEEAKAVVRALHSYGPAATAVGQ